jgi:hypothetical protein
MKLRLFTNLSIAVRIGDMSVEDSKAARTSPVRLLPRERLPQVSPTLWDASSII